MKRETRQALEEISTSADSKKTQEKLKMVEIKALKRIFDVVVSLALLVLSSPATLLILTAIFFEQIFLASARGAIFYKEKRVTQGRVFTVIKFRIFKKAALDRYFKENGIIDTKTLEQKSSNLTLVGRVLKSIYFDELPQLWNVLIGDMTLVGPRPTNVHNYKKYVETGGVAKAVLRAGLTGYFQSHKGSKFNLSQEAVDLEYAEMCRSKSGLRVVLFDLHILILSVLTVLRAEGI